MLKPIICSLLGLTLITGSVISAPKAGNNGNGKNNPNKTAKAQNKGKQNRQAKQDGQVNGTIKSIDVEKGVLVISQKQRKQVIDKEFLLNDQSQVALNAGKNNKNNKNNQQKATGKDGLKLLASMEGAKVQVKSDADGKVEKVTVRPNK